jgi:hypothetical protein
MPASPIASQAWIYQASSAIDRFVCGMMSVREKNVRILSKTRNSEREFSKKIRREKLFTGVVNNRSQRKPLSHRDWLLLFTFCSQLVLHEKFTKDFSCAFFESFSFSAQFFDRTRVKASDAEKSRASNSEITPGNRRTVGCSWCARLPVPVGKAASRKGRSQSAAGQKFTGSDGMVATMPHIAKSGACGRRRLETAKNHGASHGLAE